MRKSNIPDHPAIARALRTGYPDVEPRYPRCPICNQECEMIYWSKHIEVVGCEMCLETQCAWEYKRYFEC